jgi:hypothetical protein
VKVQHVEVLEPASQEPAARLQPGVVFLTEAGEVEVLGAREIRPDPLAEEPALDALPE